MSSSPRNQKEVSVWLHVSAALSSGERALRTYWTGGWVVCGDSLEFSDRENILALLGIEPVSLGCPGKMVKTVGMNSAVFNLNTCTVLLSLFFVYIPVTVRRN